MINKQFIKYFISAPALRPLWFGCAIALVGGGAFFAITLLPNKALVLGFCIFLMIGALFNLFVLLSACVVDAYKYAKFQQQIWKAKGE